MVEKGRVINVKDKTARIEIKRVSACGDSCASCKGGCETTNHYVDAVNNVGAKPGDMVDIEMSTKTFMSAVAITYGIPLIMLIIGIASGGTLFKSIGININSDIAGVLLGFGLMAISYIFINKLDKRHNKKGSITFEIVRILD